MPHPKYGELKPRRWYLNHCLVRTSFPKALADTNRLLELIFGLPGYELFLAERIELAHEVHRSFLRCTQTMVRIRRTKQHTEHDIWEPCTEAILAWIGSYGIWVDPGCEAIFALRPGSESNEKVRRELAQMRVIVNRL